MIFHRHKDSLFVSLHNGDADGFAARIADRIGNQISQDPRGDSAAKADFAIGFRCHPEFYDTVTRLFLLEFQDLLLQEDRKIDFFQLRLLQARFRPEK